MGTSSAAHPTQTSAAARSLCGEATAWRGRRPPSASQRDRKDVLPAPDPEAERLDGADGGRVRDLRDEVSVLGAALHGPVADLRDELAIPTLERRADGAE